MKRFNRLTKSEKVKILQEAGIDANLGQRSVDLDQLFSGMPKDQQDSLVPMVRKRSSVDVQKQGIASQNYIQKEQELRYTSLNEIPLIVSSLAGNYKSGITQSIKFRITQLRQLHKLLTAEESVLQDALFADLGKSPTETFLTEINIIKSSLANFVENLEQFMEPKADTSKLAVYWGETVETRRVPWGVVCIIGPWNYPLQLTLGPLAGYIKTYKCNCSWKHCAIKAI